MNSFGTVFRVNIYGESHTEQVGVVIDGVPAGIEMEESDFKEDLNRRRSGNIGTTPRKESDTPHVVNGYFNGRTTGAPLHIYFKNENIRSKDYSNLIDTPRPGHADFTAKTKFYGFNDYRGGGHFSGRLTLGLVAAGVVGKKVLEGVKISAKIVELGGKSYNPEDDKILKSAMMDGDSLGAIVECCVDNLPIGLGEPFFNSVESLISHAIFAIPGVRGIEFGSGFNGARERGSEHNDCFINERGETSTNSCGGINGGISNGNQILFRVAFKPTSSISKPQETFNFREKKIAILEIKGRHDVAFALRVPVVVEAVTAIVLADLKMIDGR